MMVNKLKKNSFVGVLNWLAQSVWFDFVGIGIVLFSAWTSGYLMEMLNQVHDFGAWSHYIPFGMISFVGAVISLMSNRLTARMENAGNWIGLISIITSGVVDYLLGNRAAIITYPITFIIQSVAIKTWMKSDKYKATKPLTGFKSKLVIGSIFLISLVFSYLTNSFGWGNVPKQWLFYITVVVFALSLAANVLNAMKLTLQWKFWSSYNVIQLIKAFIQGNFVNVGKYVYYILVAIAGLVFWKDKK